MSVITLREAMDLTILAGEILLKNGAETSRVEETMERIGLACGLACVETFVIPTGIQVSLEDTAGNVLTKVKRVRDRTVNLERIARVNELSRRLSDRSITPHDARRLLERIARERTGFNWLVALVASGVVGAGYAFIQGGGMVNIVPAFAAAATVRYIAHIVSRLKGVRFVFELLGAMAAAAIGIGVNACFPATSRDTVIIGGIMPLVPGMAITNAIRDLIAGDLLAGATRGIEAIITSLAVAMGVIIVLAIWLNV